MVMDLTLMMVMKRRKRWEKMIFTTRRKVGGGGKYCSFRRNSSCAWVSLQNILEACVEFVCCFACFLFSYKTSPPKMSIKMAGIRQFGLGEGVDGSGVTTKILTCNFPLNLLIEKQVQALRPSCSTSNFGNVIRSPPFRNFTAPNYMSRAILQLCSNCLWERGQTDVWGWKKYAGHARIRKTDCR
ncbi:hypothetical protein NC651_021535 [Populus alba x Populus x berolinensis]|nr:hypothetical protein NC651_021535 [Populus alba x Populus x berolinensis]